MLAHLRAAADRFGVILDGGGVREGLDLRSVSSGVRTADGVRWWLRVGRERTRWITDVDYGDFWTGMISASDAVRGVVIPRVLEFAEWPDGVDHRVRADLMTRLPGAACSSTDALRVGFDAPAAWWDQLRQAVTTVAATSTTRFPTRIARGDSRVREVFGPEVAALWPVSEWATAHNDLHWANLMAPGLAVLDWELWGPAPVHKDAATLYLFSVLVPEVTAQVRELFADELDSTSGRAALVGVAARILRRADRDGNADLATAVRAAVEPLISPRSISRVSTSVSG
jgi:hypothetical protein